MNTVNGAILFGAHTVPLRSKLAIFGLTGKACC
jgi:hypothetical protein